MNNIRITSAENVLSPTTAILEIRRTLKTDLMTAKRIFESLLEGRASEFTLSKDVDAAVASLSAIGLQVEAF